MNPFKKRRLRKQANELRRYVEKLLEENKSLPPQISNRCRNLIENFDELVVQDGYENMIKNLEECKKCIEEYMETVKKIENDKGLKDILVKIIEIYNENKIIIDKEQIKEIFSYTFLKKNNIDFLTHYLRCLQYL